VIFLNIFPPSLLNIGLYTYIVRYKSGIKVPGFLRNISQKKIQKKEKYFIAYGQVLKNFPSMFSKEIASFSRFKNPKMDIITSLDHPLGFGQNIKNLFPTFFFGPRCRL
jgi:hypothetical protein